MLQDRCAQALLLPSLLASLPSSASALQSCIGARAGLGIQTADAIRSQAVLKGVMAGPAELQVFYAP